MPYIKQEDRVKFENLAKALGTAATCAGDLNYVFTVICHQYIKEKGLRYQNINDIMGALTGTQLEMYRKIVSPYEDIKINENTDIGIILDDSTKKQY
jgi:hypothetical protein